MDDVLLERLEFIKSLQEKYDTANTDPELHVYLRSERSALESYSRLRDALIQIRDVDHQCSVAQEQAEIARTALERDNA